MRRQETLAYTSLSLSLFPHNASPLPPNHLISPIGSVARVDSGARE